MQSKQNIQDIIYQTIEKISSELINQTNFLYLAEGLITEVDDLGNCYIFQYQGESYVGFSITGEKYQKGDLVYVLFSNNTDIKKMILSKTKTFSNNDLRRLVNTASDKADSAKKDAGRVLEQLDKMTSDNWITSTEKLILEKDWNKIKDEFIKVNAEMDLYGGAKNPELKQLKTDLQNDFTALKSYVEPILSSSQTEIKIDREVFLEKFNNYYVTRQNIMDAIVKITKEISDETQKLANINKQLLADIANDNKLTPSEKQSIVKEREAIISENTGLLAQAEYYGILTTDYTSAYNSLLDYLKPLLSNTNSTSDINGISFRQKFSIYYEQTNLLKKAISLKTKEIADKAERVANKALLNSKDVRLFSDTQVFSKTLESEQYFPEEIKISVEFRNTELKKYQYKKNNNSLWEDVISGQHGLIINEDNSLIISSNSDLFTNNNAVTFQILTKDANVQDSLTILKLQDGKIGENAFSVLLTNEAHVFPSGVSSALNSSTYTDILAFEGTKPVPVKVLSISTLPTGLTAKITNNNSNKARITFDATTLLTEITDVVIKLEVKGQIIEKHFSYSLSFKGQPGKDGAPGQNGIPGEKGDDGVSIVRVETYYKVTKSNTEVPKLPSIEGVNGWGQKTPDRYPGEYIWMTTQTVFSDGKTTWSAPTCSTGDKGDKGNGIKEETISYGVSDSTTIKPSEWVQELPFTKEGQYLWTKKYTIYTDPKTDPITTWTYVKQGKTGPAGQDGNSIISVTITYGVSSSALIQPDSWSNVIPDVSEGEYLWTRTVTDYTKTKDTVTYTYSKQGKKGTSVKVTSITYQEGESPTEKPQGQWFQKPVEVAEGKYLWAKTIYSDGSESFTVAKQGVSGKDGYTPRKGVDYFDGKKGEDGKNAYLYIRYSANKDGSSMSSTPTATTKYIGIANTASTIPPASNKDYNWSKYIGENGVKGEAGPSGKPSYLHIAYANSSDGSKDFSTTIGKDKMYIGQYTDDKEADSSKYTDYTWTLIKGSSVTVSKIEYQKGESAIEKPTGQWSDKPVSVPEGQYLWTRTIFSDGKVAYGVARQGNRGPQGAAGNGIKTVTVTYGTSLKPETEPLAWFNKPPIVPEGQYLWTKTFTDYTDPLAQDTTTLTYVKQGKTGPQGPQGNKGDAGNGIKSVKITYGISNSATTKPLIWEDTPPLASEGQYLWTKTFTDYTEESEMIDTTTYNYVKQGKTGPQGVNGISVNSVDVYYKQTTSTTSPEAPVGSDLKGWTTKAPEWINGRYIWSCTQTKLSNNSITYSKPACITGQKGSDGKNGSNGTNGKDGNGISSITVSYGVSTSASSKPSSWSASMPTSIAEGSYLWTRTITDYTDSSVADTVTYTYARQGKNGAKGQDGTNGTNGQNGKDGTSVTVKSVQYQAGSSATVAPTGSWSSSPVPVSQGQYLWTKTTFSDNKIAYGIARQGSNGSNGKDGTPGAIGQGVSSITEEYYLSTSKITQTGGSWATTPPVWKNGKYVWTRSKIVYKNPTATEYTTPVCSSEWEAVNDIEIGGRNLLRNSSEEKQSTDGREYFRYADVAPIFDKYGEITYSLSFDIKSLDISKNNKIRVYMMNGSGARYSFVENVTVTTEYARKKLVIHPKLVAPEESESWLAFYGTYGTGCFPVVKNVKIELGNKPTDWTPAPEDVDASIKETTDKLMVSPKSIDVEYAKNSSPTTAPSGGWSTNAPVWENGKFIWTRTKTVLNNEEVSISKPVCITGAKGAQGEKGEKGIDGTFTSKSAFTPEFCLDYSTRNGNVHWGDADIVEPKADIWKSGNTIILVIPCTNGDVYTSYQKVESSNLLRPTKTYWINKKGETGSIGQGVSSITEEYYLSTSKTTQSGGSWATTPPVWENGKYVWTRSKIVYKNPTATTYTTPVCSSEWEAVNEVQVGGRNLLVNSNFKKIYTKNVSEGTDKHENTYAESWGGYNGGVDNPHHSYHAHINTKTFKVNVLEYNEKDGNKGWKGVSQRLNGRLTETGKYIISMDMYSTTKGTVINGGFYHPTVSKPDSPSFYSGMFYIYPKVINQWHRVTASLKLNSDAVINDIDHAGYNNAINLYIYGNNFKDNGIAYIKNVKLEKGNKATDWTSAPEDIDAQFEDTRDEIHSAVENSAAQMRQDYTTLIDKTNEEITASAKRITEITNEQQALIQNLSTSLEITAEQAQFIKTTTENLQKIVDGKMSSQEIKEWARFDGANLELGASNSPFKCQLSNTELAFYQGANKVAWISNNELNILTAIIAKSIGCGNFVFVDEDELGFSLL